MLDDLGDDQGQMPITTSPARMMRGMAQIEMASDAAVDTKCFHCLLGYTVTKACASPRNLTWFTRPFLLGLGLHGYETNSKGRTDEK